MTSAWYGSDRLVHALSALGVEYLVLNPGASIRGLHDSLVHPPGDAPELALALHEEIAVAMAHGYVKVAGRPMAVGLHDTVGLLHASMAIFNAWVDRAPMLLLVGTGPLDATHRRPWLDWVHTVNDQGSFVRDFTVWNEQPTSIDALLSAAERALNASMQSPTGPALVTIDIDLQEGRVEPPDAASLPRPATRSRLGPDPVLVDELARWIASARNPLFIADRPLSSEAASTLIGLAERVGAGLVEAGGGGSIPVGHAHDLTDRTAEALSVADLIVLVDVRDPAWAVEGIDIETRHRASVTIAERIASLGYPALARSPSIVLSAPSRALHIPGDVGLILEALRHTAPREPRELPAELAALAGSRELPSGPTSEPIDAAQLAILLAASLVGRDVLVANGELGGWMRRAFRFTAPEQYLGRSGGLGLGYGPGAAVGAALAARGSGRIVIDVQGDGDLLYTPQALWTAVHHRTPLLIVVNNNRTYGKDEQHQAAVARARARPTSDISPGIRLETPAVDFAALARSLGAQGHGPIRDPGELGSTLRRAVDEVADGAVTLVDVWTS